MINVFKTETALNKLFILFFEFMLLFIYTIADLLAIYDDKEIFDNFD